MMFYMIMGIFVLVGELLLTAYMIKSFVKQKGGVNTDNLIYLASSFVILYILYYLALNYSSATDVFDVFANINNALDAFTFKLDLSLIRSLTSANVIFKIDFIIAICLASVSTISTVIALFSKRIINKRKVRNTFKNKGDIVLGDSETGREYVKNNPNSIIWDDKADYKELIDNKIGVCVARLNAKNLASKINNKEHHLILFKDSSCSYSDVLEIYEETIQIRKEQKVNLDEENALFLHIEASVEEQPAINEQFVANVSKDSNSYVTCFNKYELMARRFVIEHPMTKYIPRDFFNSNLSLKDDKDINVVFVGFDKISAELFKMLAMETQFAKENKKKKEFYISQVNYHIYDRDDNVLQDNSLSLLETDLDKFFKNADTEKIEKICNIIKKDKNVYSHEAKQEIENLINDNSYTYVIVALYNDLENVAYASSLVNEIENDNFKVFARVEKDALYKEKDNKGINKNIIYFGKDDLLNHANIVNEDLIVLAQRTNDIYKTNSPVTKKSILSWQNIILIKQYANIYQALSMFFKINLLGFDVIRKEQLQDERIISKEEFYNVYPRVYLDNIKYEDYKDNKINNLIGFIEHSRWNAHYFISGYKPMKFEEFAPVNGGERRNHQQHDIKKRHVFLTSNYDGLDKVIKTMYLMDKYKEEYKDKKCDDNETKTDAFLEIAKYYYYDFMVMNEIYDIFETLGYSIVDRKN